MDMRKVWRVAGALGALVIGFTATSDAAIEGAALGEARWRQFFAQREFGEDPYFFFPEGETGPTGCPAEQRLSFGGADSSGVRLTVIDERGPTPRVRAECTARYVELRGEPHVSTLPDGRAMWALEAGHEAGSSRSIR